jgi:hypothetical protein
VSLFINVPYGLIALSLRRYTTRAFAPLMAKAAKLSIVEVSVGRAYCLETAGKGGMADLRNMDLFIHVHQHATYLLDHPVALFTLLLLSGTHPDSN